MNGTDEQLYDLFLKERSEEVLLVLVKRHAEGLALFINGFVHDMNTAQELALDAFAEVAAGPTFFSARSSFKTWLFSVGRNLALKYLRKSRFSILSPAPETISLDDIDEDLMAGQAAPPEMELLKSERNRMLYTGLSKINEDYRLVLILLYFEEMTHEEAASVMGRNKKQIYNLAERGRNALKEELLKMGFEYEIDQ